MKFMVEMKTIAYSASMVMMSLMAEVETTGSSVMQGSMNFERAMATITW